MASLTPWMCPCSIPPCNLRDSTNREHRTILGFHKQTFDMKYPILSSACRLSTALFLVLLVVVFNGKPFGAQTRTVSDKQVGSIFQAPPAAVPMSVIGAFDGNFGGTDPDALHIRYATFQAFAPDNWNQANFPLAALKAYEASEVAAGRPRIFIHATYEGQSRPVYFNFPITTMAVSGGRPTTPQTHWYEAVNACDPRFVRFWINHYQRPIVQAPFYNAVPVFWTQNDNGAFNYDLYGVLDYHDHFVTGVKWDPEFPQGPDAFFQCMASFYTQVAKLAPDIQQILNIGTWSDLTEYSTVMQNLSGVMQENIAFWSGNPGAYVRNLFYNGVATWFPWMISQNKSILLRSYAPDSGALVNGFVAYELLAGGGNGFFAPGNGHNIINPSQWLSWSARLGSPTAAMVSTQTAKTDIGYRRYSRSFEGGTVYLNLGGSLWDVPLSGGPWYGPSGDQISTVSVKDGQATFVTRSSAGVPLQPLISPRSAFTYQAPLRVTLSPATSGTVVRYTTNGSEPTTASAIYSTPLVLKTNTIVKARSFTNDGEASYTNTMKYSVSSSEPTLTFVNSTDYGLGGTYYPVLQLSELPAGTVTAKYSVNHADGSIATGVVSFLPNQTRPYRYFPVTVTSPGASITITQATGAVVGTTRTMQYNVIGPDTSPSPSAPTNLTTTH